MAASQALFSQLAEALGRPSKAYRAAQAGLEIPESGLGGYIGGLQAGNEIKALKNAPQIALAQRQSALLDNFGKLSDATDRGTALKLMGPILQQSGIDTTALQEPSTGASLDDMQKQFEANPMSFNPKMRTMLATARNQSQGNAIRQQIADAMKERVGVMKTGQELSAEKAAAQYGGAAAAQPSIKESFNRVAQVQRTRGLLDQIRAQGGQANPQQRAELAMSTARTLNPTGVMTNEALDMMLPQSAVGKYGSAMQYIQNAPYDTDFAAFSNRFSDLLDREEGINKQIIQSGGQYAAPFARFGARGAAQADLPSSPGNPNVSTGVPTTASGDPMGLFK